ncbi:TonB-dependent receptor domain-containing protein [Chryseobacterium sp.]|jgi:iron complex outermembrane receptor protein|uniref:TonB-dependent receptor plug domain-containing protein n=1 Tax=Chryseobacterium sp. TaxID=1871047 RepID=UPI002843F36D|nr:TonB-dependent receptor [Chryseobacterium sp.]MDR3026421.1 TonB-dependent receptor [Chryseobacterium sp.]
MDIKRSLVLLFSSYGCFLFGQEKTIDTIYVFDNQMNRVKLFHPVKIISAEEAEKNSSNLSELLRFQSQVFIKENGRGAVSSPSFRGTTAQQTAFVWNGININSNFLGQGDINNIALFGYDQIGIKAGGGSVVYGSGAIGGSIHLNNTLDFNKGFHGSLFSEIASFNTYNNFVKGSYSNDKFSFKASGNYSVSENNYEVSDLNYINRNGNYYNTTFNVGASYKITDDHKISWQSQFFDSSQHYPVYEETGTKTKYKTQSVRSLLSWDWNKTKFNNSLRAAYTEENFQYFGSLNQPKSSGGTGKNYIFKNDFNYFLNSKWNFNIIGEFQINKGEGYESGISNVSRNVGSVSGLLRYFVTKNLRFEGGFKKDFVEDVKSPLMYSFSGKWSAAKWYDVSVNVSKNFRYPSFNDIYYEPGGNKDLRPETSTQVDMTNEFKVGDFRLTLSPYYMNITDLIAWLPTAKGYWQAFNVNKVESYGLESQLSFSKQLGNHKFRANAGYYYARSIDKETQLQRPYVPMHRGSANIDYEYSFFKFFAQGLLNGVTYTTSDEKRSEAIDPYFLLNMGVSATLAKKYTLGFKVNNLTNTYYKTVSFYPLPKRNYSVYAAINF